MPVISVIVPVYNTLHWLEECVSGILQQSFPDFELILVDDGSTDGSGALCDRLSDGDTRIRVIHQENQGLSGARNSGLDIAAGEYIAFVDSDDTVLPDFLSVLLDACRSQNADMALCSVEDVNEDGTPCQPPVLTRPGQSGVLPGRELLNAFYDPDGTVYTVAWNKLYRATLWEALRYPVGKLHEDEATAHILFWQAERVACIDQPLYRYRLRQGSICRSALRPSTFDGVEMLIDRCLYFSGVGAPKATQQAALSACWHRYLYLCGQAAQQPTDQLTERICELQPQMRGLILPMLLCPGLSLGEKLSAIRRAVRSPKTLCKVTQ